MERTPSVTELQRRVANAQVQLTLLKLDAMLLTSEVDVSYFTGLESQFWHSPTRPIALVLPASLEPIAVVPEIMEAPMRSTWIRRIETWPSIQASIVQPMVRVLQSIGARSVAMPMNVESHVRLPIVHWSELLNAGIDWVDASALMQRLRILKSPHEVSCIRKACRMASDVLHQLPKPHRLTERELARAVRIATLRQGADDVPYVVVSSGALGYESIVDGPTDRRLGTVVAIDVGCTWGGYWCDFNRNYALGAPSERTLEVHRVLWDATSTLR